MKTPHNEKTVTLKLKRIDVCNLKLACASLSQGENRERWKVLHNKLKQILEEFDEKHPIE
jgi:hypothetical protein